MQMTLDRVKKGQQAKILKVGTMGPIRRRIIDMGAVSGTPVHVVKVAPLGDPIEIKIKGYSLTLRREEAAAIQVELGPDEVN
jgi:ferrous iron transport protein A